MGIKKPDSFETWEFENNKIRKSLPEDLIPEEPKDSEGEEYRSFLLTLTMIFNDLKGLMLLNDTLVSVYRRPDKSEISGHAGEYAGIRLQLLKLLFATIHEALEFIRLSKDVYESRSIQKLLGSTPDNTQLVWEMLSRVANNESIDDTRFARFAELRDFLVKARNNVGFHYQTHKQLIEGYRRFFFTGIGAVLEDVRKWAYRSVMKTGFAVSRYYYTDAALQGYYINLFGDEKLAQQRTDEVFKLSNLIVFAIHDLVIEYHASLPNR